MAQNQRKALYDAIRKSQERIASGVKTGQFGSKRKDTPSFAGDGNELAGLPNDALSAGKNTEVSSLSGTLVISVPYRLGGIIILALLLLMLMAFWLGQRRGARIGFELASGSVAADSYDDSPFEKVVVADESEEAVDGHDAAAEAESEPAKEDDDGFGTGGDNVIVIATVKNAEDLLPVQEYFAASGVKTEIVQKEMYCFLVTSDKFANPKRQGSRGYRVLQLIKKIGLDYKVPKGGKNFGKEPFQDAYGMKVNR